MAKFNYEELLKEKVTFDDGIAGKKIMLYGTNDTGKTYQACHFPNPLLIMTEAGGSAVNCPKVDCTDKWSEFKDVVDDVCKNVDKYKDILKTLVIDTAENLVKLSERSICNEFGVRDLSEITGKQNGYNLARTDFQTQINRLTAKGYTVVFICHEEITEKDEEVGGGKYNFTQPKGTSNEKSSMRMLRDLVDFCIYLKPNGIDNETFETIPSTAICKRTKSVFARSRFAIQTIVNPFTADNLIKAIEEAVKKSAENEGAEIGITTPKKQMTKEDYFGLIKPYVKKLMKLCGEEVTNIVEAELGVGKKVTQATDDDLIKLDNIYNNLVTKATLLGVEVDEED
jgi:hypothetical protein